MDETLTSTTHDTMNMKMWQSLIGLVACCVLSGCAQNHSKAVSETVIQPNKSAAAAQPAASIAAITNNFPLSYQWYIDGTNVVINGVTNHLIDAMLPPDTHILTAEPTDTAH